MGGGGAPTTPESKLPKLSPHFTFRDACTQKLKSPPTSARQNLEGGVVGFMLSVPKLFPGMSLKNTVGKHVPERASMLKFQPGRFSFTAVWCLEPLWAEFVATTLLSILGAATNLKSCLLVSIMKWLYELNWNYALESQPCTIHIRRRT